jgi:hypothetical protein
MIINPYLVVPGTPPYDPDAAAFITATGISGTEATAINELVLNLKNANIWTKFNALYPFIGGTATQHKFNLKNPLDTDAAFRLQFSGGWTHSSNGATPNGTNAYADTFLNASTNTTLNSNHLSIYVRTNQTTNAVPIGAFNLGSTLLFQLNISTGTGYYFYTGGLSTEVLSAIADSKGFFMGSQRASNDRKIFRNGTALASLTSAITTNNPSLNVFIGARNQNNTAVSYTTQQIAFSSIGSGLTDLEAQVFNQIVEGYQFALSRNINPSQSFYYNRNYSVETNAYLYSTQITDVTTQGAINTLVSDLKGYGIWTKMKALYPFAGSTATTQKFNLVNSQDTNEAFRLTFAGGWTHSSNGALPNGTNAYADTFHNPSVSGTLNSAHLSYYSRTNSNGTEIEIGCQTGSDYNALEIRTSGLTYPLINQSALTSFSDANSQGFYVGNRQASNDIDGWKNGIKQVNGTTTSTLRPNRNFFIGALNSSSILYYTTKQCAFASIGDGLTDAEASNFYTAVQNFQTTLGRQV